MFLLKSQLLFFEHYICHRSSAPSTESSIDPPETRTTQMSYVPLKIRNKGDALGVRGQLISKVLDKGSAETFLNDVLGSITRGTSR